MSKSILLASACALALSACGSSTAFFAQEFGAPPNDNLADFTEDADVGERISVTQHTGRITLRGDGVGDLLNGAVTDDEFDLEDGLDGLGRLSLGATGDGEDRNPFDLERASNASDADVIVNIASRGPLPAIEDSEDGVSLLLGTNADDPDDIQPGDDVVLAVGLEPGSELNYMSVIGWLAAEIPQAGATVVSADFGIGHFGLRTPEADMPDDGVAWYDGVFAGVVVVPGAGDDAGAGVAFGDAMMEADFGEGMVWGEIDNVDLAAINLEGDIDFLAFNDMAFEADITGATFAGTAWTTDDALFAENSSGPADGVFYGPVVGDGPAEAGVVLTIHDDASDAFVTGVVGAEQVE